MTIIDRDYPIRLNQAVVWGDMDAFGHVNNTVFFRYFEDARWQFFNQFGVNEYKEKHNVGPILASTTCNFRLPLTFPDRIQIGARYDIVAPKKIIMTYAVYSEQHEAIAAEGESLLVYYDYQRGQSCAIPTDVLNQIQRSP